MTKELLQQSLDALESLFSGKQDDDRAVKCSNAILALREAIAQPVQTAKLQGLTEEAVWSNNAIMAMNAEAGLSMPRLMELVRTVEAAHHIAQPVQPVQPADSVVANEPPLLGRWHHGHGCLVSGTIRIAQWDCDTNPPSEFREDMLNWMCETLNAAVTLWEENTSDEFDTIAQPVQPALIPAGMCLMPISATSETIAAAMMDSYLHSDPEAVRIVLKDEYRVMVEAHQAAQPVQPAQQANDNKDALTLLSDAKRLYIAVEKMCTQAGAETTETVEWLCGPYGGMAKLFSSHFSPVTKTQSFGEKYPRNPDTKCKCEHWEACVDCHPTYVNAAMKGDV